jgi:hypothetical protein
MTAQPALCSQCGQRNPEKAGFCGSCGYQIVVSVADTRVELQPAPASVVAPAIAAAPVPPEERFSWGAEEDQDEATRYLCAAVHLDSSLAEELAEKVLEEPLRSVARSPGVDLVAVMKHVLAARSRHLVRDIAVAAALVLLVVAFTQFAVYYFLFLILLAWAAVFTEAYVARWGVTGNTLRRGKFRAADAPEPKRRISREQIGLVASYAAGNVTVYSGYKPFLGNGFTLDAWSLALDVTKPANAATPAEPVLVGELHDKLKDELAKLDFPGLSVHDRLFVNGADIRLDSGLLTGRPERPVAWVADAVIKELMTHSRNRARPYLTVEIVGWGGELVCSMFLRLLVNSTNLFVEASYSLLPPLRWDYHEVDFLRSHPGFWEFVRLAFRSLLRLPGMMFHCLPRVYRQAFAVHRRRVKARSQEREIRRYRIFDHGSLLSIRELAADLRSRVPWSFPSLGPVLGPILSPVLRTVLRLFMDNNGLRIGYQRYFQVLDKDMYLKAVEKRVFTTIGAFLKAKNVDPDELIRRAETIINSSVHIGQQNNIHGSTLTGVAIGSPGATVTGSVNGSPA